MSGSYIFEFIQPELDFGESTGMILLRDQGSILFRDAVEKALKNPFAHSKWYRVVFDELARSMPVWTGSVIGLQATIRLISNRRKKPCQPVRCAGRRMLLMTAVE